MEKLKSYKRIALFILFFALFINNGSAFAGKLTINSVNVQPPLFSPPLGGR